MARREEEQYPVIARPPQGITIRYKGLHPRWKAKPLIDPESLRVDGQEPWLALPIPGSEAKAVKQVTARDAALMLTCDFATGGQSVYRLATDDEVAAAKARYDARRPLDEASRARDLATQTRK